MKPWIVAAFAITTTAPLALAQFGSGIVYDPTQSAHAVHQILQSNQLYTTTIKTTENVIGAYNLAQRMANLPESLYTSFRNLGHQEWTAVTRPANTYGNSEAWINAASTGYGAATANQNAGVQSTSRLSGYSSLSPQGQQAVAAQGATVDLSDAANTTGLQTIGTIRANSAQRESDISQLEAASHSADPAQHTEMATFAADQPGIVDRVAHAAGDQPDATGSGFAADCRSEGTAGQPQVALSDEY